MSASPPVASSPAMRPRVPVRSWSRVPTARSARSAIRPWPRPRTWSRCARWSPSRLFYAVVPRSAFQRLGERLREAGVELPFREPDEGGEPPPFGVDDHRVTTTIDVSSYVEAKHRSMAAHATQMGPNMFFMRIPPELFGEMFGREFFQLVRGPSNGAEADLFGGL